MFDAQVSNRVERDNTYVVWSQPVSYSSIFFPVGVGPLVTVVSESRSKLGAVETQHTWTGTSSSNVC
jgi:hypothetical protein